MKKILKIIGGIILGVVVLALVLVLTLPLWLGPVVKPVANAAVPKMTKTTFNLGHLSLNPYTGRFELGDMQLGNPEGYSEPQALSVSNIVVDVAMTTACDKYVHVEEVLVDGVFVSLVKGGPNNVDNMLQIQYNVAGGKEKYEANKAKAEAEKEAKPKEEKPKEEKADDGSGKKIVIDKLTLNNIRVKYGVLTIPVPSITLTDLGKDSGGATFSDIIDAVWGAIVKAVLSVGDGVKAFGDLLMSGAGSLGDGASKAASAVGDGAAKAASAVSDSAGKAASAVGDGAVKAASAVGDGTAKAASAVGDGVGKAASAVGDGATKTVEAVGDGAGKAVNAIKGLFK